MSKMSQCCGFTTGNAVSQDRYKIKGNEIILHKRTTNLQKRQTFGTQCLFTEKWQVVGSNTG